MREHSDYRVQNDPAYVAIDVPVNNRKSRSGKGHLAFIGAIPT